MPQTPMKRSTEMRRRSGHATNGPWFARGPGLGIELPRWTQQRMFTDWDAYLDYIDWRDLDHLLSTDIGYPRR